MSNEYNKYKSEVLYRVSKNVVGYLETKYTQLENSYYVHIDTTEMKDERSVMISIRSIKGFLHGEYDMITAHIEDLIEDEYRRRKRQDSKIRKEKKKETIPIEDKAIAFVIGKGRSNIKRICGKFKDAGVYIECPKRGSNSNEFTISARSQTVINEVIDMLLESEHLALENMKKKKKPEQKEQKEQKKQKKQKENENEEEAKIIPEA